LRSDENRPSLLAMVVYSYKNDVILDDWIKKHKKFKAIGLDYDYSNSNYHTKREGITKEVLVVNY